jgi:hypothetical protein
MDINFKGLVSFLISVGIVFTFLFWSGWELIDYLFIDDVIRVTEPLVPEIELVVNDNKVDTIYV